MNMMNAMSTKDVGAATKLPRGRPRDTALRNRILATAAELAAGEGVEIGFDRIAQAAGASRTTLYRWWRSPHELFLDALLESARTPPDPADSPVLERIRAQLEAAAVVLVDRPTAAPLRVLAAGALTSAPDADSFRTHWLAPRRGLARELIRLGIDEGVIVDEDPELLIDLLFAPLYHRAFFTGAPIDDDLIDALLARVRR